MTKGSDLILVAVCTRDRPRMLRRCLASLAALEPVPDSRLAILVVDNGDDPAADDARAAAACAGGPWPFDVTHQPTRGIPQARNRALETALSEGAAALIFVDDDQTLPPDWATTVVRAWREEGVDAVETPVAWEFEGHGRYRRFFERKRDRPGTARGEMRDGVPSTNGVLIARRLFDELGLRFEEDLALAGGEDTLFFEQARDRGARFVLTRETRATEYCPAAKETWRWLLRRSFRVGANKMRRRTGAWRRARYAVKGVFVVLLSGFLTLLLAPLPLVSLRFAESAARGAGLVAGALGGRVHEYRNVVGD